MRTLKKSFVALTLTSFCLALFAVGAHAGTPGHWSKVAGPVEIISEPGLARTPDGTLHMTWASKVGLGGTVNHTTIAANAASSAGPTAIFSYPSGLNNRMALIGGSPGLQAFFGGLFESEAAPLQGILATATNSGTGGSAWSVQATGASNGESGEKRSVYAGDGIAAVRGNDGVPVTAWGSPGAGYHVGTTWTDSDLDYATGCCVYGPGLGVDAATGEVVLAWQYITGTTGTAYKTILPAAGAVSNAPSGNNAATSTRTAITGRIGGAGVYLAYLKGSNQFLSEPAIVKTGSSTPMVFGGANGAQRIGLVPSPSGRLWIFWSRKGMITAARSNVSATAFGARVTISPPSGTSVIYNLAGEGSLGPLDLIALIDKKGAVDEWHQRIMPGLTLSATSATGKIKYRVTDAGAPVKNAKVKAGGKTKKTNSAGRVTIRLRRGRYKATATRTGYTKATKTARSR
jgi:hypothetical protein